MRESFKHMSLHIHIPAKPSAPCLSPTERLLPKPPLQRLLPKADPINTLPTYHHLENFLIETFSPEYFSLAVSPRHSFPQQKTELKKTLSPARARRASSLRLYRLASISPLKVSSYESMPPCECTSPLSTWIQALYPHSSPFKAQSSFFKTPCVFYLSLRELYPEVPEVEYRPSGMPPS
ncbi:hypothetical protein GGR09_000643 [Bartonella heixiaziensis]